MVKLVAVHPAVLSPAGGHYPALMDKDAPHGKLAGIKRFARLLQGASHIWFMLFMHIVSIYT
jgi:hypothetical protein